MTYRRTDDSLSFAGLWLDAGWPIGRRLYFFAIASYQPTPNHVQSLAGGVSLLVDDQFHALLDGEALVHWGADGIPWSTVGELRLDWFAEDRLAVFVAGQAHVVSGLTSGLGRDVSSYLGAQTGVHVLLY